MALDLAKELNPYFLTVPEWTNEGNGYALYREGVGLFGQKVTQRFNHEFQCYDVHEIFETVKRWNHATPDRQDPDHIYRSNSIEFTIPKLGAAVSVHSPERSADIFVATYPFQGNVENANYTTGVTSPVEFKYHPKRLVGITMQGEFVSFSDPTATNLPLQKGLTTLVALASVESPERLEQHKRIAREEVERRFKKEFEPGGEEVKTVELKINQVLGNLINELPAGEAASSLKVLDALGFREKLTASFLSFTLYHPAKQAGLDRLSGNELDRELSGVINLMIDSLYIYSRKTSRRWLEVDRIKPGSFRFRDWEEEVTSEVVEGKDWDTGEMRKEFRGITQKYRKDLGRASYGQRIPLLDYGFEVDRARYLSVQAFTRGQEKWRIDNVLYKIPAANILALLRNPSTDPRWITLYVPIQPQFK